MKYIFVLNKYVNKILIKLSASRTTYGNTEILNVIKTICYNNGLWVNKTV